MLGHIQQLFPATNKAAGCTCTDSRNNINALLSHPSCIGRSSELIIHCAASKGLDGWKKGSVGYLEQNKERVNYLTWQTYVHFKFKK